MISAFEDGSDVGLDLIDLACLEERAKDSSPAFDQEVGHGALCTSRCGCKRARRHWC